MAAFSPAWNSSPVFILSATARRCGWRSVTGSPGRTSSLTLRPKNEASLMISSGLAGRSPFSMAM